MGNWNSELNFEVQFTSSEYAALPTQVSVTKTSGGTPTNSSATIDQDGKYRFTKWGFRTDM